MVALMLAGSEVQSCRRSATGIAHDHGLLPICSGFKAGVLVRRGLHPRTSKDLKEVNFMLAAARITRRLVPLLLGALLAGGALAENRVVLASAGIHRSVEDAVALTLASLPATAAMAPENRWWASVDTIARPQLESTRGRAKEQVEDLYRNYSDGSFKDFDAWFSAVGKPSIGVSDRLVRGDWQCRTMRVNRNGAIADPFKHCVIRKKGSCLELAKESGRRWAGCLHRVNDHNFALVQSRQHYREMTRVDGFLSASSASHLRLIVTRPSSLEIYEFVRR